MQSRAVDEGPSSRGPSMETPDALPKMASSLTKFDKAKKTRALSRRHRITDTRSLVEAYNVEKEQTNQRVLAIWIRRYGEIQDERQISDAIREYAELMRIKPRTEEDQHLLNTVFAKIQPGEQQRRYPEKNASKALYEALLWMHPDHFLNESLIMLTQKLLSSLSSSPRMYNAIFEKYEGSFLALRQSIVRLCANSHQQMSWTDWQALRKAVREKRQSLEDSFKYYPVSFQFALIEQGIECLNVKDPPFMAQIIQCVSCGSCNPMTFLRGSSSSNQLGSESAMKRGTSCAKSTPWYHLYCKLEDARLKTVRRETDMKMFLREYEELMKIEETMEESENRKALRFGIIHELCQLALYGKLEVRKETTEKLLELLRNEHVNNEWMNERAIFEALLEAVHRAHKKGNLRGKTEEALRKMTEADESHLQREVVAEWLGSETIEDKLRMQADEMTATWQKNLFGSIAEQVGYIPFAVIRKNIEALKRAYQTHSFTTVQPIFDREAYDQIQNMQHHIAFYNKMDEPGESGQSRCAPLENEHAIEEHERQEKPHITIDLENLFADIELKKGVGKSKIRKVLLYGNPGCGKTSISKVIAYKWANGGDFMNDMDVVYVVPVSKLNGSDRGGRGWKTFAEAVANICYSHRNEPIGEDLLTQVDDDLDDDKTLLVLDGIDEGDEKGRYMVTMAKKRQCKILLLSRPYNLFDEVSFADLEVECLGLSEDQIKKYIMKELPKDGEQLIAFAKEDVDLWKSMRNPVKVHIICLLWKEKEPAIVDKERRTSDYSMYTRIVNLVWSRFAKRPNMSDVPREDILQRIEFIAFSAFAKDKSFVSQTLVEENASSASVREIIRDSGYLFFTANDMQYHFPHKITQEYFVGRYLARTLEGTTKNQTSVEFLTNGKYTEKNRLVISFMTQAIARRRRKSGLREVFSFVEQEPREIIGVQHFFLKLCIFDKFLAGLWESEIEEAIDNDTASQFIRTLIRIIEELKPKSSLWDIMIAKLGECPNILRQFHDEVFDALTEETKVEEMLNEDCFEDIVTLTKRCRGHTDELVRMAEEKLIDDSEAAANTRLRGLSMVKDILAHHEDRADRLLLMLKKGGDDAVVGNRKNTMFFVRRVVAFTHKLSEGLLDILEGGLNNENETVKTAAMMTVKFLAVHFPKELREDLLPLIEEKFKNQDNMDIRLMATKSLVYLQSAENPSRKIDELIEEAKRDNDDRVKNAAKSSRDDACTKKDLEDYSRSTRTMIEELCDAEEERKSFKRSKVEDLKLSWQGAVEAVVTEHSSVVDLLKHLIQFPVTVEQTSKNRQAKPVVHAAHSEAMPLCDRGQVNNLVSEMEGLFEDEYPGMLSLLRSV